MNIDNFKDHCSKQLKQVIQSDFGLNRGHLQGFKSATLGRTDDLKMEFVGFDIKTIYKVRVYHGSALDGIKFYYKSGTGTAARSSNGGGGAPKYRKGIICQRCFVVNLIFQIKAIMNNHHSN